jgi:ATP/maltotriose-dependent transcriptional regulator MalT
LLARDRAVSHALENLGLVAVVRGDAAAAKRIRDELLRHQEDYRGWFARSAGLMAHTAGDIEAALEHFDQAYTFTRDAGYRPEHAWVCCDEADALLARRDRGDVERARLLHEEGHVLAAELGMKPLERRTGSGSRRSATRLSGIRAASRNGRWKCSGWSPAASPTRPSLTSSR